MRFDDRVKTTLMHATARWTVRYGENLRFAGNDLPKPEVVKVPTRHGKVPVHVYRTAGQGGPRAAHVHFHGGAWLMRHPGMDDWWCRYLAATTGLVVLNVDFRTAPYVVFPVAQEQCHDVAAWAANGGLGLDGERITVGGFSSGGGLAASVCLQARDSGSFRPALQVLGVPALDMASEVRQDDRASEVRQDHRASEVRQDEGASDLRQDHRTSDLPRDEGAMISAGLRQLVRRVYFPDVATRAHPYASPVLAPDLSGLPPALVLTAERDALRGDGERYAARLRQAGVAVTVDETPGVDHYFLTEDPRRARRTMAMVADALLLATEKR